MKEYNLKQLEITMSRKSILMLVCGLLIIGTTAGGVAFYQDRQELGRPGIRFEEMPGKVAVQLWIPEDVTGYRSVPLPITKEETDMLPDDTSFARRRYIASDGLAIDLSIVLMGGDQSSIHRPQSCIPAQGWTIAAQDKDVVTIDAPVRYQLEFNRLKNQKQVLFEGQLIDVESFYVYWFVADGKITSSREERILSTALHMLSSGEVERWAYVSMHVVFPQGAADKVYPRLKELMELAVPQFQLAVGQVLE